MEGIAAFALACNVLQVIEFGTKVIVLAKDIHQRGASAKHQDLESRIDRMLQSADAVAQGLQQHHQTAAVSLSTNEISLQRTAKDVVGTAKRLSDELAKLKAPTTTRRLRTSLGRTLKTIWNKRTIEDLEQQLFRYQELMETQILVSMNSRQSAMALEHKDNFKAVDSRLATFIKDLADGHTKMSELLKDEHKGTRDLAQKIGQDTKEYFDEKIHKLTLSDRAVMKHERLLASLKYPEMNLRKNNIDEPHEHTFEWIFDQTVQRGWSPFVPFLKSDINRIYWIKGKPGSGKSHLMKFLCRHEKTHDILREGHPGQYPLVLSFFCWIAGTHLQRNSKGFWSSLVFQLLDRRPNLIHELEAKYPDVFKKDSLSDWPSKELQEIFIDAVDILPSHICIFVDGLDEFDKGEGAAVIIKHIMKLSSLSSVWLVVSSRPEPELERAFCKFPQLKLQDLTEDDIKVYVKDTLHSAANDTGLGKIGDEELDQITHAVLEKAEGVFLWVRYVLKSLLGGLIQCDTWQELMLRLERCPSEIQDLYCQIWNRLNRDEVSYRAEAAGYFRFAMTEEFRQEELLPLWQSGLHNIFNFMFSSDHALQERVVEQLEDIPLAKLIHACQTTEVRLAARSAGLLEVSKTAVTLPDNETASSLLTNELQQLRQYADSHVSFIHRSALSFLQETDQGQRILSCFQPRFCAEPICEGLVTELRLDIIRMRLLADEDPDVSWIQTELDLISSILTHEPHKDSITKSLHHLVQSIQFKQNCHGTRCQIDGWNFPLRDLILEPSSGVEVLSVGGGARDFMGLAAEQGLLKFIQSYVHEAAEGRVLSQQYKDYLLLCSSWPFYVYWRNSTGHIKVDGRGQIRWLLDEGADPNSDQYSAGWSSRWMGEAFQNEHFLTTPFLEFLKTWITPCFDRYGIPFRRDAAAWAVSLRDYLSAGANLQVRVPISIIFEVHAKCGDRAFDPKYGRTGFLLEVTVSEVMRMIFHCETPPDITISWPHRRGDDRKILYILRYDDDTQKLLWCRVSERSSQGLLQALDQYEDETEYWRVGGINWLRGVRDKEEYDVVGAMWKEVVEARVDEITAGESWSENYRGLVAEFRERGWMAPEGYIHTPFEPFEAV